MKRQRKKPIPWIILSIILAGILIGAVIYFRKQESPPPANKSLAGEKQPPASQKEPQQIDSGNEGGLMDKAEKKDPCREIESQVREFFQVLDKEDDIRQIKPGTETYEEFIKIIKKLSASPPSPAGEGLNPQRMAKNIFYFFRVLNDTDLKLIKEIIKNEEETLEMNLVIFYQWMMLGDPCPDPDGIRPSFSVAYSFAGFFVNTIGGRAYLFRRSPRLRQLVSYYSLLIIHEADKRGENTYGIDIFPEIRTLIEEMRLNPELLLQQEYLEQLNDLLIYYQTRR